MAEPKATPGEEQPASLRVLAIFASPEKGAPMIERDSATVDARGIIGDRYPERGFFYERRIPNEDRGITIISSRGIEEANEELQAQGIAPFTHGQTRRNLVVDIDVAALNVLNGRKFWIGDVEVEGTEPCAPCKRPGELSGRSVADQQAFIYAYVARGGLRIRLLKGGKISKGTLLKIQ